jgi:anaerobic dimethyl sulfoxide reductase subunit A
LQLITTHCKRRAHTQFDSVPWLKELLPHTLSIHPIDAIKRNIRTGDEVRVFNDRGEIAIQALVTERLLPGVVDIPEGASYDPDENGIDRGGCANVLTRDVHSPGGALCYNTSLVQVEKAQHQLLGKNG